MSACNSPTEQVSMSRVWGMPSHETFTVRPIGAFVQKYLTRSTVSVDPFARNNEWATHRNDLNPSTTAPHHMDATDFLVKLKADGVVADLVLIDPPYSPRQVKECYDSIGHKMKQGDALLGAVRKKLKAAIHDVLGPSGIVLHFGWNTVGMGTGLGYRLLEIVLVCHGSDHNDTICVAERREGCPDCGEHDCRCEAIAEDAYGRLSRDLLAEKGAA